MGDEPQIIGIYRTPITNEETLDFVAAMISRKIYLILIFLGDDDIPPAESEVRVRPPPYAEYVNCSDKLHEVTASQLQKLSPLPTNLSPKICSEIIKKIYRWYPNLF